MGTVKPPRPTPPGTLIDRLNAVREKKRIAQEKVDAYETEYKEIEEQIFAALDAAGTDRMATANASVSISPQSRPKVFDWDSFYAYVHKKKAYHLLERRPAAAGCNELFDQGKQIPGVEKSEFRRLNLRNLKS